MSDASSERWTTRREFERAAEALRIQARVLSALFFREAGMRRGRAYALGWLAAGLEPLIIVGAISTLFILINRSPAYGESMLLFVGTGVFPIYLFIHTSMRIREPLATVHLGRYPLESPLDEVFVHAALHLLVSLLVAALYFVGLYAYGVRDAMPSDLGTAFAALVAVFALGVSMGVFNSVVGKFFPFWNTVWPGLARAALHFSGLYFVADYLSPNVRRYFAVNPLVHAVNWFRHAFYPFYPDELDNRGYVILASLVAVVLGLALERILRRDIMRGEPTP